MRPPNSPRGSSPLRTPSEFGPIQMGVPSRSNPVSGEPALRGLYVSEGFLSVNVAEPGWLPPVISRPDPRWMVHDRTSEETLSVVSGSKPSPSQSANTPARVETMTMYSVRVAVSVASSEDRVTTWTTVYVPGVAYTCEGLCVVPWPEPSP